MILAIDVGIRNLALAALSCEDKKDFSTYSIEFWGSFDTLKEDTFTCQGIQKNGKVCGKKCCYKYDLEEEVFHTCKSHFPKEIVPDSSNKYSQKKIKDYTLQDLATATLNTLNDIYSNNKELFDKIKCILIELQPTFAVKMKFISHIIFGKLTELFIDKNISIKFVRATEKLKVYDGPELTCELKGAYAKRKWMSIQHTIWFLENKFTKEQCDKWLPVLNGKGDDSADCLCYCLYYFLGSSNTRAAAKSKFIRKRIKKNSKTIAII